MMIIHTIVLSTIIKRVLFLLAVLLTGDNLEEAIVVEGNILDEI